jgi:pSer/pThr/pTyr-binding forkhead associated (FHA) protein
VDATGVIPISGGPETGELGPIDAAKIADLASGSAHLVVRRGALEGMQFPLLPGELMSIGRSSDSKIFLDDVTVSRKHASVSLSGSDWVLTDAGSLNGTYVNKMRVSSTTLVNGDELQIGKFRFIFVLAPSAGH